MIREALEYLHKLAPTTLHEIDGRMYRGNGGALEPVVPPAPTPIAFASLTGFAEYVEEDISQLFGHVVVVKSHAAVELMGPLDMEWKRREYMANTVWTLPARFAFGQHMGQEAFITGLQACFVRDARLEALLAFVGNIVAESSVQQTDDGISQAVTAKAGVARVAQVTVPNPVVLALYRSFPEIEQVPSPYILRMRRDDEKGVQLALFEQADAWWSVEAHTRVKDWLKTRLAGKLPVIG